MLKKLFKCLSAAAVVLSLTACGSSSSSTEEPAETKKDTFTVGFDQNFPPFGYVDENGEFAGFDIEMATEAAKRMGKEVVLQPIDWDAKDMELESGTIDCIWNGFTINGREDQYTWSKPYFQSAQVILVRKDSGITTLADLKDKTVDVQKESSALTALEDEGELIKTFKELIQVGEYNTAIMDLESGAVDAVAVDYSVALDQIKNKEDLMILDEFISDEQYGVGFKKGNTELRDEVQKVLDEMIEDGFYEETYKKYFDGEPNIPEA